MSVQFVKRYRMAINLEIQDLPRAVLPEGYFWREWSEDCISQHAHAKFQSFENEADRHLFLSLGTYVGCLELMKAIVHHQTFLSQATWLIEHVATDERPRDGFANEQHQSGPHVVTPCATIQGLAQTGLCGSIQNVGVAPQHRGLGLGKALVLKCLRGFRSTGRQRITLDVSAENVTALSLYESVGFRVMNTSFKQVRSGF